MEIDESQRRHQEKAKRRHQKWQERQERSKLSRAEIEELQVRCADLRRRLERDDRRQGQRRADLSDEKQRGSGSGNDSDDDDDDSDKRSENESGEDKKKPVKASTSSSAGGGSGSDGEDEEDEEELEPLPEFTHFNQLPLSQRTLLGLERGNYKKMTPIQSETLHLALAGLDVMGAAKTGSGKTLCFVLPTLDRLFLERWDAEMGVGALLLSPTRELALQIFKVMQVVGYKHVLSAALLTGGRDVGEERKRLHAISIIIGTPGRVLHHFQEDANLVLDNLQILCMDEADRLLDLGFRETITKILAYLPTDRQTLLFSATQSTDVQMLAQLSLKNPRYVTAHAATAAPTPITLSQNFLVIELHRKLDALLMFLKRHPNDKTVVFVSTCNQVRFMYLAFSKIMKKMRIPSMCLTSKMKQFRREEVFLTFCRCKAAVLFCTDIAARGLDFPLVHWVIQYDCPDSAQTYIHRAGRTARAGARGATVLFLTPRETPMLSYLANKRLPLREVAFKRDCLQVSREIFVALVVQGLKYEAQKAFIAYMRSLYFASNKHVFDVTSVDVEAFARSLGLPSAPDMSELTNLQRSAKNLPYAIANFIAAQGRSKKRRTENGEAAAEGDGDADDGPGGDKSDNNTAAAAAPPLTRKEKTLQASDMFRVLQQKRKYDVKEDTSSDDGSDDGFLVKKKKNKAGEAEEEDERERRLTAEERLAGLSKHKRRKYVEAADLRVRDLGLNRRVVYAEDDSDDEDGDGGDNDNKQTRKRRNSSGSSDDGSEGVERVGGTTVFTAPTVAAAVVHGSDGDEDGGGGGGGGSESDASDGGDFTARLARRVQGSKAEDLERARKLRWLRKQQREGKVTRKTTLAEAETARHKARKRGRDEAEDDSGEYGSSSSDGDDDDIGVRLGGGSGDSDDGGEYDDDVSVNSDGSLAELLRSVQGGSSGGGGGEVYHGIDSEEDNDE